MSERFDICDLHDHPASEALLRLNNASARETSLLTSERFDQLIRSARLALFIPEGCAHGFLTLSDDAEVAYQISGRYQPAAGRGVRFDDPAFAIDWPDRVVVINDRDSGYPDFEAPS